MLLHNAKNTEVFLYRKTHLRQNKFYLKIWSYFKAVIHFQAIQTRQIGSIFGNRTTF